DQPVAGIVPNTQPQLFKSLNISELPFKPRFVTVIVEGDRITAIARNGRTRIPTGATIVDGRGKHLIPGLWDMHVHIGGYDEGTKVLPLLVAYGITGVRDMAPPRDDILRLRGESADGTLLGPQIVAAGPILQRPLPCRTSPLVRKVTDSDAKQVVDDLQAKGVDFIKVGETLTREAYFGIASEAPWSAVCRASTGFGDGPRSHTSRAAKHRALWKRWVS